MVKLDFLPIYCKDKQQSVTEEKKEPTHKGTEASYKLSPKEVSNTWICVKISRYIELLHSNINKSVSMEELKLDCLQIWSQTCSIHMI
jgi:hypothetical protein